MKTIYPHSYPFKEIKKFDALDELTLSGLKNINWFLELKALRLKHLVLDGLELSSWGVLKLPST